MERQDNSTLALFRTEKRERERERRTEVQVNDAEHLFLSQTTGPLVLVLFYKHAVPFLLMRCFKCCFVYFTSLLFFSSYSGLVFAFKEERERENEKTKNAEEMQMWMKDGGGRFEETTKTASVLCLHAISA